MAFDVTPYQACFEDVHPSTLQRIIAVESGENPIALNINGAVYHESRKAKKRL